MQKIYADYRNGTLAGNANTGWRSVLRGPIRLHPKHFTAGAIFLGLFILTLISLQNVSAQPPDGCRWQLSDEQQALAGSEREGVTVTRSGNTIETSYRHAGNMGCNDPTFQTTHSWTQPPNSLIPGETISFEVSAAWQLDGSPDCSSLTAGVNTSMVAGINRILAERKKIIVAQEPEGSISNSGNWMVPAGQNIGETLTLTAHGDGGGVGGSVFYTYEWDCQAPLESETPQTQATPTVTLTPPKFICPCPPEQGGDSGARFSDFSGEVTVAHCTDPKDTVPAEMDMVLSRGIHINTEAESSAILSFADMTTFAMKPFTRVILDCAPPKETNLQLLAGKIWGNLKKMLKDGTMNVTLNQAVAGIKGTVFVLEEDGQISTVKVLRGSVLFTSRATGESVLVNTGEMVSASATGLTATTFFDIGQELAEWPPELVLEMNSQPPQPEPTTRPAWATIGLVACFLGLCGLLILGLGFALFYWLKKARAPQRRG